MKACKIIAVAVGLGLSLVFGAGEASAQYRPTTNNYSNYQINLMRLQAQRLNTTTAQPPRYAPVEWQHPNDPFRMHTVRSVISPGWEWRRR